MYKRPQFQTLKSRYWREGNDEVDFILQKSQETVAIEVKSGKDHSNTGLSVFRQKFNPHAAFVVGGDDFPAEEFLSINPIELFR